MAAVARICRYPIKGLSAQDLQAVPLRAGEGLPGDRAWALARPEARIDPARPGWLPKRNFLMLMRDERLAAVQVVHEPAEERILIRQGGRLALEARLGTPAGREAIERFFEALIGPGLGGRPRLVQAPGQMLTDEPVAYVSLINLATVAAIEGALGRPVDPLRFRANLYVNGLPAWAEFGWVGGTLAAGDLRFEVAQRIERCAATNVDPVSAARDLNLPLALRQGWGHSDCGVMLRVTRPGTLARGISLDVL